MTSAATSLPVDLTRVFGPTAADFLARALAALRQSLPVEEVWLFGSCARGEAEPDSDLDLLVVLEENHGLVRPNLACYQVVARIWPRPPVDVIAISKSRWEEEQRHPFGLFGDVLVQGVCLYARRSAQSPSLV